MLNFLCMKIFIQGEQKLYRPTCLKIYNFALTIFNIFASSHNKINPKTLKY